MADTKEGREEQAATEQRRQRERDITEARTRADEVEPSDGTADGADEPRREDDDGPDSPRLCHRRGCDEQATFEVLERYQEETGHGAVEVTVALCRAHADDESPTNLDNAYEDYVFRVKPLPSAGTPETA
jgi:hypothetical protein